MLLIDFYSLLGLSAWNKSNAFLTTLVIIIVYKIKFSGMKFQYPFVYNFHFWLFRPNLIIGLILSARS